MDQMNLFNNSLSEQGFSSLSTWKKHATILLFLSVGFILFFHINKWISTIQLKKQKNAMELELINFDKVVDQKERLIKFKEEISRQLDKIEKRSSIKNKELAYNLITGIISSMPDNLIISTLSYDSKNDISVQGASSQIGIIILFIQNLSSSNIFSNVKLEAIKHKDDYVLQEINNETPLLHEFFIKLKLK